MLGDLVFVEWNYVAIHKLWCICLIKRRIFTQQDGACVRGSRDFFVLIGRCGFVIRIVKLICVRMHLHILVELGNTLMFYESCPTQIRYLVAADAVGMSTPILVSF
jgi:hypothetical protein